MTSKTYLHLDLDPHLRDRGIRPPSINMVVDIVDTEQTPLLGTSPAALPSLSHPQGGRPRKLTLRKSLNALRRQHSLFFCLLFVLLVDIPAFMNEAPRLRMLELSLCRDYHSLRDPSVINGDGSVPEDMCKLPEIQGSLAKQMGLLGKQAISSSLLLSY